MSKYTIKNGAELVARADDHAKFDRIAQGTYGRLYAHHEYEGIDDGGVPYVGCFIGCLSTPAKRSKFQLLLNKFTGSDGLNQDIMFMRDNQVGRLTEEFGICNALATSMETVFEALPSHMDAIEFIPRASRAIAACEGVVIDNDEHQAWLDKQYAIWEIRTDQMTPYGRWLELRLLEYLEQKAELAPKKIVPQHVGQVAEVVDEKVRP